MILDKILWDVKICSFIALSVEKFETASLNFLGCIMVIDIYLLKLEKLALH